MENFGKYFTYEKSLHDPDVRDLDTNDDMVAPNLYDVLDSGKDFQLMIGHLIGLDHAGHAFGALDPMIEKKMLDIEGVLENVIEKMDEDTTLVVFGDHGQTVAGSHGGNSALEMRTVFFAY